METLTPKDFTEKLNANAFKSLFTLQGFVKKSDAAAEILFTQKNTGENWIKIPTTIIDSVLVLKIFESADQTNIIVKLQFKEATTSEGIVFQKLLMTDYTYCMCSCQGMKCGAGGNHCGCGNHCECGCKKVDIDHRHMEIQGSTYSCQKSCSM